MTSPYQPLGCFGKLPFWREYLEEHTGLPVSHEFKTWLLEGHGEASLGAEGDPRVEVRETAHTRFIFGPAGSAELLVGVVRPSADLGGRRNFPFSVFTHFPRKLYGKEYALQPLALGPIWDALDDAWESLAGMGTREAFRELFTTTLVPAPAPVAEIRATFEGMRGESARILFDQQPDTCFGCFAQNMPEVLKQIKKGGSGEPVRLELPVSSDKSRVAYEVSLWIELLSRQFLWHRVEPSVFLPKLPEQKSYCVLLIFGMIGESEYPLIMGCEGRGGSVLRPARRMEQCTHSQQYQMPAMTYAELSERKFS